MTDEDAKAYAMNRWREIGNRFFPVVKVTMILRELLEHHDYVVACPLTGRPLVGMSIKDGVYTYESLR